MVILSWNPPPPRCLKNSDNGNFLKNRRVLLRILSFLWGRKFATRNGDVPSFGTQNFDTPKGPSTEVFDSARWKKITENLDNPSLSLIHKKFSSPDFLRKFEVFHHEVFRHCTTNFLRREIVILPLLQKIYKSVVNLIIVENLWRPDSKQCFVFNRLQNFIKK